MKRSSKKTKPKVKKIPSVASLKLKAIKVFNKFIRERDKDKGCISCNGGCEQAGHFYSAGHYNALRFNEDNTNGQCVRCNHFLSGNLIEYRKNLIEKIGIERVERLDYLASESKKHPTKFNRFYLLEIIEKYK